LLQAGLDVVIFGCGSLSASVSAGQASLGFCVLSFTFNLYSSAVGGRHSNEFPACSNTRPLAASFGDNANLKLSARHKLTNINFDKKI